MIDFFEFSNEMLCVADHRGHFVRVNQSWTTLLGWSADELTSRPYIDFVHPEDLEATVREARLLFSGSYETVRFENRYRSRDGSYRWLAWHAKLEPESSQLVATARDITDQRLQAEALSASEERFRLLATHAPIGIAQSDAEGRIVFANDKWCELADVPLREASGFVWKARVHPDDLEGLIQAWHATLQAGRRILVHDFRFLHRNGDVRWASSSVSMLTGSDGNVVGHIGSIQDITERKNAEMSLLESEERFHAFMDNSPAIAWSKDRTGRIVFLNKACEQQLNLKADEWYGKTDFDIWPAEVALRLQENDRRVLESRLPVRIFEETASPERPRRYWMTILFPYQDRLGQTYVGGIALDISELKRAEIALEAKQQLLGNLIEVQENEKQRLCHEFHDGLIQYAVGAMMSLEGYHRLCEPAENVAIIDKAIGDLRKGIEDGRRSIRGIRPAVLDDSDLNAGIYDLIDEMSASGIMIAFDSEAPLGRLPESIQTAIYRVVQEALNNARKHSGTDVIRIELRKSNGDLLLEVRDFGCGFEIASARMRGFGLLGINERVRLLGGDCSILSEKNVGTRIVVRLPIPLTEVPCRTPKPRDEPTL